MLKRTFEPYRFDRLPEEEMLRRAGAFREQMSERRSIRMFSSDPVPQKLIELAIESAMTAPSGANCQPWFFAAVSDPATKKMIRLGAEAEEKKSYEQRMPQEWLEELEPLGTTWEKPFLEIAPWLVVVFAESYRLGNRGEKRKNYYVQESVGIACGFFLSAIHNMGLVTLTHTPSPMGYLRDILGRPSNERPFILFPVGFPDDSAEVPILPKKKLSEASSWLLAGSWEAPSNE